MSHIPNAAMPHAGGTAELERDENSGPSLRERAGKIAEHARAHPKTAAAAGAAVIAGVAAAAIPLVRGRKSTSSGNSAGKGSSSRSRKKS